MKKDNHKMIIISVVILTLSFIIFYVGQFLFYNKEKAETQGSATVTGNEAQNTAEPSEVRPFPIEFRHSSENINGYKQEIFTIEFDPSDERIEFKPVLSYDNVFGFEKISEISERTGAYAAINGGFFYEYGDPVGMTAIDGKLYMAATGYDPVLIVDDKGPRFEKIISNIYFSYNNKKININKLNRTGKDGNIVLYTSEYGSSNRAEIKNTSLRIENNVVTDIYENQTEVALKEGSQLISFYGKRASLPKEIGIKKGDFLVIEMKPDFSEGYQAYSCGSMLVSGGKVVVPDKDRWAGTLLNRDPRTAIGIKADGRLVFMVVDGRQPGYSAGLTGKEMAEYLIQLGVSEAAMLDGGATSQIFVEGRLRNRPSDRGMERPVAGAFIVKLKDNKLKTNLK